MRVCNNKDPSKGTQVWNNIHMVKASAILTPRSSLLRAYRYTYLVKWRERPLLHICPIAHARLPSRIPFLFSFRRGVQVDLHSGKTPAGELTTLNLVHITKLTVYWLHYEVAGTSSCFAKSSAFFRLAFWRSRRAPATARAAAHSNCPAMMAIISGVAPRW